MKKIVNINLGGQPYTIDEDAYDALDQYLDKLKIHFQDAEGLENIIQDIEIRMAELLAEFRGSRQIIEMSDVQRAIELMGQPEQLDDQEEHKRGYSEGDIGQGKSRMLYRDGENKIIAGVCSGLAAYLGVNDPLWIRLVFLLSVLGFGFGLLPYVILWLVVPVARTSSEKLAMSGQPVNINSIAGKIQDDLKDLSKRITDLGRG